jgi:hypothetical protein
MEYIDYTLDISSDSIKLDNELKLPIDKLGWTDNQQFKLKINTDGSAQLIVVKDQI